MTEMPQLVAALHSFVGLAAVFIGLNADIMLGAVTAMREAGTSLDAADLTAFGEKLWKKDATEIAILKVEVFLGIFIGAVTFTGSVVAFGKLAGKVDGKPKKLMLPNEEAPIPFISGHWLNAISLIVCLILGLMYFNGAGIWTMVLVTLIAGFIGWHLIMGIGGADMPVVVSMLNSYSGWAASATGFMLSNDLLIVTGALVGSSGAILSYIMCRAMNRKFLNVIAGGFGTGGGSAAKGGGEDQGEVVAIDRLPTALFKQPTRPDVDARGAGRRHDDDDKKQCKICIEEFAPGELLRTLPCAHIFHQACIDHWLAANAICPICRIEIKDVLSFAS